MKWNKMSVTPKKKGHYVLWFEANAEFGSSAQAGIAYWDGEEWGGNSALSAMEDGLEPVAWAVIEPPVL